MFDTPTIEPIDFKQQFHQTILKQNALSPIVPLVTNAKHVLLSLMDSSLDSNDNNEYNYMAVKMDLTIQAINDESMGIIMQICKIIKNTFENYMEHTKLEIIELVAGSVQQIFKESQQSQESRADEYLAYYINIAHRLNEQCYQMVEYILNEINVKNIKPEEFHEFMTETIEQCTATIAIYMSDWIKVPNNGILYMAIKQLYFQVFQNINHFVHRTSLFCNTQMEWLNEILVKYPTLANVRTYQVLQMETSILIISEVHKSLRGFYFFRLEFHKYEDQIVNQTIRKFYEYSKLNLGAYTMSTLTTTFQECIQLNGLIQSEDDGEVLQTDQMTGEDYLKYKSWLNKKRNLQQQQQLTKGSMGGALAGGSIGAGLGCLIIDSADESIPWEEKFKRAGFTTVTTGMLGAALRLPVVGILIQQALIAYAIKYTASNKVLSTHEKAKNMAHIGAQSTVGVGSAIAGQILIPIPVLGAIIGGTVGGVAMGLYQKFIIPKTKPSITKMLQELEPRMMPDGLILYDQSVIKIMKISKDHFIKLMPENLQESEWLTVVTVYTINELHYILNSQFDKKATKLQEKIEATPKKQDKYIKEIKQLEQEQEDMEVLNVKWEKSRIYISQNQINTLKIVEKIGEFVNGMLENFKI